ncbi:MAG: RICIN domain-containing protein [Prevotella sp.]|nr:RICIN domain-containing protein [Prevotella sp.]MBR4898968.1 RICIN domain-containing protein [Prevotella sp.]
MRLFFAAAMCLLHSTLWAQTSFSEATTLYLLHSSGNHLEMGSDGGGWIESSTKSSPQQMVVTPVGQGYYTIQVAGQQKYLTKTGDWNSTFGTDPSADEALWAIEQTMSQYVKLRCKANNKYLGTDSNDGHQKVYTNKDGADMKHQWYFGEKVNAAPPTDTLSYMVHPQLVRQHVDGWGVSLCWWAGQCGKWPDNKIDEIVDWLVSPTGLNYSHFRYNIGGGDDPENRNCEPHHMGKGKGLRAEMEGFKDFSGDEYHWDRDAAQRKIMLKIREKRPDAVFEAFSNSCPYYMTYSGCVSGNTDGGKDNLKPEYYEEFAHYLVDVCKHYKDEYGIEFKTLEPFNESVTGFWYANGPQEGCHFDYQSQINFIRVLEPILRESGLNTVISASDETNVGLSVQGFTEYMNAGVMPLVGQWNTHTYSGSNHDRARLASLARQNDVPLWMSETGSGGNGIGGNLSLAQRLIDDMRYIQPEAWIDWQYMEEANDQWCTIRGSFANQTYSKVKNYYVRQQCTRFIRRGYDIVTSLCPQSLAAVNASRDTLVLVALNEGAKTVHDIDLSLLGELPALSAIKAYRTSANENLISTKSGISINGNSLRLVMPVQSIVTLVIPIHSTAVEPQELLRDNWEYLIIPRNENNRAVTATASKVTIQDIDYGDAQRWTLTNQGDGTYGLQNALGLRLTAHRNNNSSSLTAQKSKASEQGFYIDPVDQPYYKILASKGRSHGFDLSNESTAAGTEVTIWQYQGTNPAPVHRQWMLFPLSALQQTDAIAELTTHPAPAFSPSSAFIYDLSGRRYATGCKLPKGIYIVQGRKVVVR